MYPRSVFRYVVFPVFYGPTFIPPGTLYNFFQWVIADLVFNWAIRRRFLAWWTQYNLSCRALSTSVRAYASSSPLWPSVSPTPRSPTGGGTGRPSTRSTSTAPPSPKKFVPGVTGPLGPGTW